MSPCCADRLLFLFVSQAFAGGVAPCDKRNVARPDLSLRTTRIPTPEIGTSSEGGLRQTKGGKQRGRWEPAQSVNKRELSHGCNDTSTVYCYIDLRSSLICQRGGQQVSVAPLRGLPKSQTLTEGGLHRPRPSVYLVSSFCCLVLEQVHLGLDDDPTRGTT